MVQRIFGDAGSLEEARRAIEAKLSQRQEADPFAQGRTGVRVLLRDGLMAAEPTRKSEQEIGLSRFEG